MSDLLQTDWFVWGIGLILGFQILVVLLGELLYRADRRALPIGPILRAARNTVLPLLVIYIFTVKLLGEPADAIAVRAIATAFWISVLYTGLLLMNALVFQQAPEGTWRHSAPSLFQDLLRLLLVAIGAAIVLAVVWEQNLGGLIAALGVGSIVLGLALQETLGNLMSGIALLFEKPFSIGDWIEVGDEQGEVVEVNWRSVHVRTRERNLLVFPNSVLGRESIVNYARPSALQNLRLSFAFSLEDPPNKIKRVLREVAEQMDTVLDHPPPNALAREVLNDRIRYEAFLFINQPKLIPQIVDVYTTRVWYALQRAGLQMPLPTAYEINVRERLSGIPEVDVAETLRTALGFSALDAQDVNDLANHASVQHFAEGETVVATGRIAEAIYVIVSGSLGANWAPQGIVVAEIRLEPGETIGLTSLTRQQPSELRVECKDDAIVLALPRESVEKLLQDNTGFAHELAQLQAVRMEALQRAQAEWQEPVGIKPVVLPVSMRKPQSELDEADAS
ncbi:MAG: mechanosensitive ion channel domain-containing protein [Pseudomonadales bacterium]